MLTLHHLENSRSQRVLWLMEELGLDYEIEHYKRDPKTSMAPESLKQVHPLGKAPILTDDDRVLAESGPILEYLVEHRGQGRLSPEPGSDARLRYGYWMHYAEGSLMPLLVMKLIFGRLYKPPMPFPLRPVARVLSHGVKDRFLNPRLDQHLDYLEAELGKTPWFAGHEFTAADIQMSFPVEAAAARAGLDASRPNLWASIERIHARPAYQRALERGGPYDLMSGD